jgi:hypothetical protein
MEVSPRLAGEQRHLAEHLPGSELGQQRIDAASVIQCR